MNISNTGFIKLLSVVVALLSIAAFAAYQAGYRVNLTNSYPMGIWKLADDEVTKGSMVLFCPPDKPVFTEARNREYLKYGVCPGFYAPLIKRLVATEGDLLTVSDSISINGSSLQNSTLIDVDSRGNKLPKLAVSGEIPEGLAFLVSDYNERSFDSRYFGLIPVEQIRSTINPVYLW